MSVRIDGCREIQRWLRINYGEASAWINDERYREYLEYKRNQELVYKRKEKNILFILITVLISIFILIIMRVIK